MRNKKIFILILVVFILLLGGASFLYSYLSEKTDTDQLSVQNQHNTDGSGNWEEKNDGSDSNDRNSEDKNAGNDSESEDNRVASLDFTVYDADGNEIHLTDYLGKPVVVNFWASWCGPCQMEMPDFQEKYEEIGEDVQFMMINVTGGRETKESAMDFIDEQGYTFPVFYDMDSDAAITYGAYSLPTTYFIDAEGYIVARATGMIDGETLDEAVGLIYGD